MCPDPRFGGPQQQSQYSHHHNGPASLNYPNVWDRSKLSSRFNNNNFAPKSPPQMLAPKSPRANLAHQQPVNVFNPKFSPEVVKQQRSHSVGGGGVFKWAWSPEIFKNGRTKNNNNNIQNNLTNHGPKTTVRGLKQEHSLRISRQEYTRYEQYEYTARGANTSATAATFSKVENSSRVFHEAYSGGQQYHNDFR